jgi:hypothetical protein
MRGAADRFGVLGVVLFSACIGLGCDEQTSTPPRASSTSTSGSSSTVGSGGSVGSSGAATSSSSTSSAGSGGASGSTGGASSTASGGAGGLGGAAGTDGGAGTGGDVGTGGGAGDSSAGGGGGLAGAGGDVGAGGGAGSVVTIDAGPNPGCDLNGTFPGLDFINTAFVASQYQPDGSIPFKQSACNDAANSFSTIAREAAATGNCFAGEIDVPAAHAAAVGWVAVAWLHYDANYNKGYPDPYPIDPAKNAGSDAICLASKVVIKARASVDNLLVTFAAGDPAWAGVAEMVTLKSDTWTEITMPLTGWVELPIMRGFYFYVPMIQAALDNVTGPIQFFVDSGAYRQ